MVVSPEDQKRIDAHWAEVRATLHIPRPETPEFGMIGNLSLRWKSISLYD